MSPTRKPTKAEFAWNVRQAFRERNPQMIEAALASIGAGRPLTKDIAMGANSFIAGKMTRGQVAKLQNLKQQNDRAIQHYTRDSYSPEALAEKQRKQKLAMDAAMVQREHALNRSINANNDAFWRKKTQDGAVPSGGVGPAMTQRGSTEMAFSTTSDPIADLDQPHISQYQPQFPRQLSLPAENEKNRQVWSFPVTEGNAKNAFLEALQNLLNSGVDLQPEDVRRVARDARTQIAFSTTRDPIADLDQPHPGSSEAQAFAQALSGIPPGEQNRALNTYHAHFHRAKDSATRDTLDRVWRNFNKTYDAGDPFTPRQTASAKGVDRPLPPSRPSNLAQTPPSPTASAPERPIASALTPSDVPNRPIAGAIKSVASSIGSALTPSDVPNRPIATALSNVFGSRSASASSPSPSSPSPSSPSTTSSSSSPSSSSPSSSGSHPWSGVYEANKGVIGSNPNLIMPGQKLDVGGGQTHTVVKGETLSGISQRYGNPSSGFGVTSQGGAFEAPSHQTTPTPAALNLAHSQEPGGSSSGAIAGQSQVSTGSNGPGGLTASVEGNSPGRASPGSSINTEMQHGGVPQGGTFEAPSHQTSPTPAATNLAEKQAQTTKDSRAPRTRKR